MKEIATIASNLLMLPLENGQVRACAELIILTTEPDYTVRGEEVERTRPLEQTRVLVDARLTSGLIESLLRLQEELEKLEADYNSRPVVEKPAKKNCSLFYVGKRADGKFELCQTESPKHWGLGTFNSLDDARKDIEKRCPGWLVEGPEPQKDSDIGTVVFTVTPR